MKHASINPFLNSTMSYMNARYILKYAPNPDESDVIQATRRVWKEMGCHHVDSPKYKECLELYKSAPSFAHAEMARTSQNGWYGCYDIHTPVRNLPPYAGSSLAEAIGEYLLNKPPITPE